MWTYKSKTGEFLKSDGTRLGYGFAGNGDGLNNPVYQYNHNVGPLPTAKYKMTQWIEKDPHLGLCVIVLEPEDPTLLKGRAGFRIHGPKNLFTKGLVEFLDSSDGCICLGDCTTRRGVWASGDHELFVDVS